MKEKHTLQIKFDNEAALKHFSSWLSGQGEQDYWMWMEYREEEEEEGNITARRFFYHGPGSADGKFGKFMEDNIIRTQCGRIDAK